MFSHKDTTSVVFILAETRIFIPRNFDEKRRKSGQYLHNPVGKSARLGTVGSWERCYKIIFRLDRFFHKFQLLLVCY